MWEYFWTSLFFLLTMFICLLHPFNWYISLFIHLYGFILNLQDAKSLKDRWCYTIFFILKYCNNNTSELKVLFKPLIFSNFIGAECNTKQCLCDDPDGSQSCLRYTCSTLLHFCQFWPFFFVFAGAVRTWKIPLMLVWKEFCAIVFWLFRSFCAQRKGDHWVPISEAAIFFYVNWFWC
jgi:hypothetical protein